MRRVITSHSCRRTDFATAWYRRWAKELLQDNAHRQDYDLFANKFWQNAVMAQALSERGMLQKGKRAVGFGVGQERLPALFAKHSVHVTATDQDFTTQKAGHWSEHELAMGNASLNTLGICGRKQFAQMVEYMPVDMANVPASLYGEYDAVWSNCALGHLGSIPAGLKFIEESLRCLKPGGWAVHTTELNIVSNTDTVTDGDTVIFRLRDIYDLQKRLLRSGYSMETFTLTLGNTPEDNRISLSPKFGNDYSRIQFRGHILTQIVLIIHKPKRLSSRTRAAQRLAAYHGYRKNLLAIARYRRTNPTLRQMARSKRAKIQSLRVQPGQSSLTVTMSRGARKRIRLTYTNNSANPLFGVATELHAIPIVLGVAEAANNKPAFWDDTWPTKDRPTTVIERKIKGKLYYPVECVLPGEEFSFMVTLNAGKLKKGVYTERYGIVQETVGWVPGTNTEVVVRVT